MAGLYQFRFEYNAEEDRVLFRLSTTAREEYLLWFTRRYVRMLWKQLQETIARDPEIVRHATLQTRKSVAAFRRETALSRTDFTRNYEAAGAGPARPLGNVPVLVIRLRVTTNPNGVKVLHMSPRGSKEINVTLTEELLHSFCHLLAQVVKKAGWKLDLGAGEAPAPAARQLH